jgi:hypothetical protein
MTNYGAAPHLIDGEWQPAANGAAGDSITKHIFRNAGVL